MPWLDIAGAHRQLAGSRVVVASTDAESAGRILVALNQAGCLVRLARKATQAMALQNELRADLVIVDADGFEAEAGALLRVLRAAGGTGQAVALIARESRSRRARLKGAGFVGVVVKPLDAHTFSRELLRAAPALMGARPVPPA